MSVITSAIDSGAQLAIKFKFYQTKPLKLKLQVYLENLSNAGCDYRGINYPSSSQDEYNCINNSAEELLLNIRMYSVSQNNSIADKEVEYEFKHSIIAENEGLYKIRYDLYLPDTNDIVCSLVLLTLYWDTKELAFWYSGLE